MLRASRALALIRARRLAVNLVTGTKIYADADGRKAVLEGAVSVMLIPQASLGG